MLLNVVIQQALPWLPNIFHIPEDKCRTNWSVSVTFAEI